MMQKAQNTLNEIHEMARNKLNKFERVVASAGTKSPAGDLNADGLTEVNPIADMKGVEQVRHSVHIPDSGQHGAALELRDQMTSVYHRSRPSHAVEDSMISAAS